MHSWGSCDQWHGTRPGHRKFFRSSVEVRCLYWQNNELPYLLISFASQSCDDLLLWYRMVLGCRSCNFSQAGLELRGVLRPMVTEPQSIGTMDGKIKIAEVDTAKNWCLNGKGLKNHSCCAGVFHGKITSRRLKPRLLCRNIWRTAELCQEADILVAKVGKSGIPTTASHRRWQTI